MALAFIGSRQTTRLLWNCARYSAYRRGYNVRQPVNRRHLFNFFKKKPETKEPTPLLAEDDLFHPFSQSPFPDIRGRGEAIQKLAPCPVCALSHQHTNDIPCAVKFECPDCGWPTHCTGEHWEADQEHSKYCWRLREVNEDDHDLRSGRRMPEFEMPGMLYCMSVIFTILCTYWTGPQAYEEAVSFANWDTLWYTRGFPSMDTERSRRHASKVLTYPLTIGSVLHQHSYLTLSNQRLTPEGSRSLAGKSRAHFSPRYSPKPLP
jgi:splicing suppressor protein 51